jgi:hypothetical protein
MAEQSPQPSEQPRTKRFVDRALRPRISLLLVVFALVGAVVALVKDVSPPAVGASLGFVALLLVLAQIAGRSFLMQVEQSEMLERTSEAADELRVIRRNTEEELRAELKQNSQIELLLTAMKEFNLIEVDSLNALDASRPTTAFYLQRHGTAIVKILGGHWNRSEFLRPQQLWYEYKELVTRMKRGEIFRSTVCLPSDPALLLRDKDFNEYVDAIYEAADSQQVQVKRLFVLNDEDLPPRDSSLDLEVLEHLRVIAKVEEETPALEARVTSQKNATSHFNLRPPDFMMWGEGLLIVSDLNSPNELVTRADFYFASNNHSEEITSRQEEFDALFADSKRALPLSAFL